MNPNFEFQNNQKQGFGDSDAARPNINNQPSGVANMMMRDRFELLSAYLDGEVTATERRQVEALLANDPAVRRLYDRLLGLRQGFQTMPAPTPQQTADQLAQKVFEPVDRKAKRYLVWSGAMAALFLAAVSGLVPGRQLFPQFAAQQPSQGDNLVLALNEPVVELVSPDALMLTVSEPVLEIPTVSKPQRPVSR